MVSDPPDAPCPCPRSPLPPPSHTHAPHRTAPHHTAPTPGAPRGWPHWLPPPRGSGPWPAAAPHPPRPPRPPPPPPPPAARPARSQRSRCRIPPPGTCGAGERAGEQGASGGSQGGEFGGSRGGEFGEYGEENSAVCIVLVCAGRQAGGRAALTGGAGASARLRGERPAHPPVQSCPAWLVDRRGSQWLVGHAQHHGHPRPQQQRKQPRRQPASPLHHSTHPSSARVR